MNDTERLHKVMAALGPALEFEPTRLQWLRALLSDFPKIVNWNQCEDLEGTTDAYWNACRLVDLLQEALGCDADSLAQRPQRDEGTQP